MSLKQEVLKLDVHYDTQEFYRMYAETLLYLTNAVDAFSYQNKIRQFVVEGSAKTFRLGLIGNRDFVLNLKLFTMAMCRTKYSPATFNHMIEEFSVDRDDARIVALLLKECSWFRADLLRSMQKVSVTNPTLQMPNLQHILKVSLNDVTKYIKFIVYKKLRFLAKANNEQLEDFHSEVLMKVCSAFYKMVPIVDDKCTITYVTNFLKRAAHNHVINMIKKGTSQKRGRLINVGIDKDGIRQFSMLCVSHNQIPTTMDSEGNLLVPDSPDEAQSPAKFELSFSISELLTRFREGSKKHQVLQILLGKEHVDFTAFLRKNKIIRQHEDNVDYQEQVSVSDFNATIAAFIDITGKQLASFLDDVKFQLAA